jgi:adenosylcobinamide kinase / adenosylcobinamide-phosphate guanylyltransferase
MLTVLLGGARSGKSHLAVEAALRTNRPVTFVATAEAFDADLSDRITRHRAERPSWPTIEAPVDLAGALAAVPAPAFVIVDCITVWVGNLFHHEPHGDTRQQRYDDLLDVLAARRSENDVVVVSNEVGLGVHPDTSLARDYRDELGRVNQRLAALADRTLFLVAGKAVALADPWDVWS